MAEQGAQDNVGIALSGGGVRALLFGLGALRAVIAARQQLTEQKLSLLIGVSGGALAAAFAASRLDISRANLHDYDQKVLRPAAATITRKSLMFSHWSVFAAIGGILVAIAGGIGLAVVAPIVWPLRVLSIIIGLAVGALAFHQRGAAIERSLKTALFKADQPIGALSGDTHLILQATDLTSGEATYLTSRGISSWRWGDAPAQGLSLIHAARAAATFPVVFGPLRLKSPPFTDGHGKSAVPGTLSLVDGGIYDNMGSEWLINRADDSITRIVVNASQNLPPHDSIYGLPALGDVLVLLRERDIQYDATTAPRRRLLNRMIQATAAGGTTVLIDRNIREWLETYTGRDDARSQRAAALLEQMSHVSEPGVWDRWPLSNASVPTSLGKVRLNVARDLVCAGYLATATQMHVLRGWPAPDCLDPDQLMPWLGET